ncbi:EamA family transporter [Enterovibrio coralii]|uniref:EamA family transporter n=1 Tax=Enterovibrio coralii TaxID=294935 RepID=UPI001E388F6B|nr:EamA family transporter [Enterovibrio coralii]
MNTFLYIITVVIWGTTWLAIAFQAGDTPVPVSVGWRFALASLALFVILALQRKLVPLTKENHKMAALLALCLFSNNFLCFYVATSYFPSGLIAWSFHLPPF